MNALADAKKAWPGLKPVLPDSFARVNGVIHIVVEGAPYVVVVEGRNLDKLKSLCTEPQINLPKPPKA